MGNNKENAMKFERYARICIENAFISLLNPAEPVDELRHYFSEDYVQWVDGVELDFMQFLQHASVLKQTLRSADIVIKRFVCQGDSVADIHDVYAIKHSGELIITRVIAFYIFRDGKICSVEEMTHLLSGSEQDRNLGSRR